MPKIIAVTIGYQAEYRDSKGMKKQATAYTKVGGSPGDSPQDVIMAAVEASRAAVMSVAAKDIAALEQKASQAMAELSIYFTQEAPPLDDEAERWL